MCGIAGIRRFGDEPITREQILWLLYSIDHRGGDATGAALVTDGKVHVWKTPLAAWPASKTKEFDDFLEEHLKPNTTTVLLHTRSASVGSAHKNANNHPMWDGTCAVTHNGHIWNHEREFKDLDLKAVCDTDSDIIRAIFDRDGLTEAGVKALSKLSGAVAAAVVDNRDPDKVLLLKSGNPIVLASTPGQLLWASTKAALIKATRLWETRFGIPMQANRTEARFITMPTDTAWLLGPKGFEDHWEFKTAMYTYKKNRSDREFYKKKQLPTEDKVRNILPYKITAGGLSLTTEGEPEVGKLLYRDNETLTVCRNPKCNILLKLPKKWTVQLLSKITCPECKTTVRAADGKTKTDAHTVN